MSALPLEIVICYSIVISLSLILKIMKRSEHFQELRNKIKGLKKTVEESIKNGSVADLNSIVLDFHQINEHVMLDEILFELPEEI